MNAHRTRMQGLRRLTPITNHVIGPLVRGLPGFGILRYRGRRTGKAYETPINAFRRGNGYVMALTYGPDTQWIKNVLSAGECDLETGGQQLHLVEPQVLHDERRRLMPPVIREFLGLMGVSDFVRMRIAG